MSVARVSTFEKRESSGRAAHVHVPFGANEAAAPRSTSAARFGCAVLREGGVLFIEVIRDRRVYCDRTKPPGLVFSSSSSPFFLAGVCS